VINTRIHKRVNTRFNTRIDMRIKHEDQHEFDQRGGYKKVLHTIVQIDKQVVSDQFRVIVHFTA
jgi:hypothetical protein